MANRIVVAIAVPFISFIPIRSKTVSAWLKIKRFFQGKITTSLKSVVIHGRPMASSWGNATPCCSTGHRSQPKMAFLKLVIFYNICTF
jgi:hypothetical protein